MRNCLFFLFVAFAFHGTSQLDFTKLSDSSYVYTTYQKYKDELFSSHGFLKITKAGVVMIDTPWDTTQFQPLLDSITLKFNQPVVLALATHWHDDRTAGLAFYKNSGIKTYSSLATKNICREQHNPEAEYSFEEDTTFVIGNVEFQTFYPGAGHTADNIVVYFPAEQLLVGGCFIKSVEAVNLGNLADANIGLWHISAKNVLKTFPKVKAVIPGHQTIELKGKKALKHTLKLSKQVYKGRKKAKKKAK